MSKRTSAANKAIALAWSKEQKLVREGKGTRDWTPEQQQDILDRGKAYGDDGKAFEGHHMKSAEKYPEYQGDLENIQFLSRTEHFTAHDGNFQTPTNGYYNPTTGETSDFGLDKYEPCEILELSEPIIISTSDQAQNKTNNTDTSTTENVGNTKAVIPPGSINASKKGFIGTVKHFAGKAMKFYIRYKKVIDPIVIPVALATVAVVKESLDRNSRSTNQNKTDVDDYFTYDPDNPDVDDYSAYDSDPDSTNKDIIERSSPSEHIVTGHGQHYHTKEGTIWKDKEPYPRGKNLDE
ncbi:teneurin-3 [Desulfitobacterium sp. THU1]|uniref:teneurin-3 n=1 Tax=Desulfitobacterium sp. THU1 TaxID=3138072 RepID=UPI00311E5BF9